MKTSGLYAALATPVTVRGDVDLHTLDRLCDFLLERGIGGLCVGGATSEYPRFEQAERLAILDRVARRLPKGTRLLAAIGASSLPRVIELGRTSFDAGAEAVLLPMPMFFRYQQIDLSAYVLHVAEAVGGPCLLYDLPDFTNAIEPQTSVALFGRSHVIGIKDSSGRAENLLFFAEARGTKDWSLLIGDDRHTLAALEAGWDGGISGVACCCPELMVALHRSAQRGDLEEASRCQRLLDEFITHLAPLPTPWGVRVALRVRGIDTGPLPWPVAPERSAQIARFEAWLAPWLEAADIPNLQHAAR